MRGAGGGGNAGADPCAGPAGGALVRPAAGKGGGGALAFRRPGGALLRLRFTGRTARPFASAGGGADERRCCAGVMRGRPASAFTEVIVGASSKAAAAASFASVI